MIRTEIPNINPDKYIYETDLKFGQDFGEKILSKVLNEGSDFLVPRKKYLHPRKHIEQLKDPSIVKSFDEGKRFYRRMMQYRDTYSESDFIDFQQFFMPEDVLKEFWTLIPDWLKELVPNKTYEDKEWGKVPEWVRNVVPGEPMPCVQISQNGKLLAPHKGHPRQSSLFMLLQGNSEETYWYREKEPFEVFDYFRVPDLDKIEHVVTARLEPFKWYVFNHKEWHSVHRFGSGKRINIGIDFDSISTTDLIELIKSKQ